MGFDARTPLPTTAGWVPAALLKPGDMVFGFDGKPVKVVSTQIYKPRECFKVWLKDGLTLVVDKRTGFPVYDRRAFRAFRMWRRSELRRKSTIIRPLGVEALMDYRFGTGRVPTCAPIDPPERALPVDPYVFGGWVLDRGQKRRMSRFDITRELLEKYPTIPKDIPEEYMFGSFWQRVQLLRGMIDARKAVYKPDKRVFILIVKSHKLARQIQQLVESLGARSAIHRIYVRGQYYVQFRTLIRLVENQQPPLRPYYLETRLITKIEPVEPRDCIFIKTEAENNTFVVSEGFLGVSL